MLKSKSIIRFRNPFYGEMVGIVESANDEKQEYTVVVVENTIYNKRRFAVPQDQILEVIKEVMPGRKSQLLKSIRHYETEINKLNPEAMDLDKLPAKVRKKIEKYQGIIELREEALHEFESQNK